MHLLLLNNNAAVSRLIQRSAEKMGYHLDESDNYKKIPSEKYDAILVDSDCYDETKLEDIYSKNGGGAIIYIGQKGNPKPDIAHLLLEKPFLPTVLLGLLEKAKQFKAVSKEEEKEVITPKTVVASKPIEKEEVSLPPMHKEEALKEEKQPLAHPEEDDSLPIFKLKIEEDEPLAEVNIASATIQETAKKEEDFILADEDDVLPTFNLKLDEEPLLETAEKKVATSILNKEDIDEVKLLLDETQTLSKTPQEDDFTLVFEETEEPSLELSKEVSKEEPFELAFEEKSIELADSKPKEEEFKLDFADGLSFADPEPIDDIQTAKSALALDFNGDELKAMLIQEEALHMPSSPSHSFVHDENSTLSFMDSKDVKSQEDDLILDFNEDDFKQAFGEEVSLVSPVASNDTAHNQAEMFKMQIQETLQESLAGLGQRETLREALKGMRVNISITFDEV